MSLTKVTYSMIDGAVANVAYDAAANVGISMCYNAAS
jgi:hypothetical protein